MLSALILVVFLLCYCCHRNTNKNLQYWQEQPEVFTVDEQVSRLATREMKYTLSDTVPTHWFECDIEVCFWWCLKPSTTDTVQLKASHDPILNVLFHLHVSIIAAQLLQILLRIREFPTSSFIPKVDYPDSEVCNFLQLLYTDSGIISQIRLGLIKYNPAICGYKKSDYWQRP